MAAQEALHYKVCQFWGLFMIEIVMHLEDEHVLQRLAILNSLS
jgi:hypothetical protein